MSGEYGGYHGGYLHTQLRGCAEDFEGLGLFCTDEVAELTNSIAQIGEAVAYVKACDSSEDFIIEVVLRELPSIKKAVAAIEERSAPVQRVIDQAVKDAIKKMPR